MANPVLSLKWRYPVYLVDRILDTRRDWPVRETFYMVNPYKIFEEISDFPPRYSLLFDDKIMRGGASGKSAVSYKQYSDSGVWP